MNMSTLNMKNLPEHSGDAIQANLLAQTVLPTDYAAELFHIGCKKYQDSITRVRAWHLGIHSQKTTTKRLRHVGEPTRKAKPDHDAIFVFDMKPGAGHELRVLPDAERLCSVFQNNPTECLMKIIHVKDNV